VHALGEFRKNKGYFICAAFSIFTIYMIYYLVPHTNRGTYVSISTLLVCLWAGAVFVFYGKYKRSAVILKKCIEALDDHGEEVDKQKL